MVPSRIAAALVLVLASRTTVARADDPLTEKEAVAFGKAIERTLDAHDSRLFERAVDRTALGERAIEGMTLKKEIREKFLDGMKDANALDGDARALAQEGAVTFLRVVDRGGRRAVVIRHITSGGGFGWNELLLGKDAKGEVRIVDVFPYRTGDWTSSNYRMGALDLAIRDDKTVIDKLPKSDADFARSFEKFGKLAALGKGGKPAEALALEKELPESVRKNKMILSFRGRLAQQVSEAEWEAALEDTNRWYGEDGSMSVVLFEYFTRKKDYKKSLALLDAFEKRIGGDPFLDYQRALVLNAAGERKDATARAKKAVAADAKLLDAWWLLASFALDEKAWADVITCVEAVEKQGVQLGDFTTVDAYAGFVKSAEYAEWMKKRASKSGEKKSDEKKDAK